MLLADGNVGTDLGCVRFVTSALRRRVQLASAQRSVYNGRVWRVFLEFSFNP